MSYSYSFGVKKYYFLFYGCKINQNIWNSQAFACYFFKLLVSGKTLISKQEIGLIPLCKQNIFIENIIFFHFALDIYFFFGIFAHYI